MCDSEMTSGNCNISDLLTSGDLLNGTTPSAAESAYEVYFTYIYRVIYGVGILGNLFALIVWARSGLNSSPVTYFQAICVADSLVLVMHPLETLHSVHMPGACQLLHVVFLAVQVFAILLVLGLSVERYIELCHPLAAGTLITHKRTVRSILVIAALSVMCSLCEAYIWHVQENARQCQLRYTTSRGFMWTYAILVLVVLFLCPLLLVILFNALVARRIKHKRRNSYAFSVAMVPDKHNMNLSVTFVSLYLAACEIVYAAVHISHYFVSDIDSERRSNVIVAGPSRPGNKSDMPVTGRWNSYYIDSLTLMIVDVVALTSYAVDLTIFTLCSKTFRRNIRDLFQRYQRRKSLILGYRQPVPY